MSDHLAALFNTLLTLRYVPESFRTGYTVPIPKGPDKDIRIPSNYRGISLLSNISKVFEKLILKRLQKVISLNPLQGGFREGLSCSHTSFILQEAVQSIRDNNLKAYVAFLDAQKAFDTVWHEGLFVKLIRSAVPRYLLELLRNWYSHSSCSVLWNGTSSRNVSIRQGVRQGGILSPFLYSVFVDELLDLLVSSRYGACIGDVYVGAPMFADDLALVSESPTVLQSMLDIVSSYAKKWRYRFNASKSWILVFGESTSQRQKLRGLRKWFIESNRQIKEADEVRHLGNLRSVYTTTVHCTNDRASSGRSASFGLNALGARYVCLHPLTCYRLYTSLCIPIMLFSSEVWCITKTELLFLERVHRKILHTIQGLPVRCPSLALNFMMGSLDITSLISQWKLSFVYSIINLPDNSIARMIVCARLAAGVSSSSVIYSWQTILQENSLPTISSLLVEAPCKPLTWKRSVKLILRTKLYNNFLEKCNSLPVVECDMECFLAGHCLNHWSASKGNRAMTRSLILEFGCWLVVMAWRAMLVGFVTESVMLINLVIPRASSVTLRRNL